MKGDANRLYEDLKNDPILIHGEWGIFQELFTQGPRRYELLNDTAPSYFGMTQRVFLDRAVLSLSKLTDHARYDSLARLVELLKPRVLNSFFEELQADLVALQEACAVLREHRHKRIAHRARKHVAPEIKEKARALPPLPIKGIETAMQGAVDLMNKILGYFESKEQYYKPSVIGGPDTLLFYLQEGLDASRQEATDRQGS